MGSTRLPGKVLAPVGGRPMLQLMLERLLLPSLPVQVVVATSTHPDDEAVALVAESLHVPVVRGPEHDVLDRYLLAVDAYHPDSVVRLTADCPLIDPTIVAELLVVYERHGADYASNTLVRTFPDGLDAEVVSAEAIRAAASEATEDDEREHVTPFVYRRPERYRLVSLRNDTLILGHERWTVDTPADLERVREAVSALSDPIAATWRDVLAVLGRHQPRHAGFWPATDADRAGLDRLVSDPGTIRSGAFRWSDLDRAVSESLLSPAVRIWLWAAAGRVTGCGIMRTRGGLGSLAVAVADEALGEAGDLMAAIMDALAQDLQVAELVLDPVASELTPACRVAGLEVLGGRAVWSRRPHKPGRDG